MTDCTRTVLPFLPNRRITALLEWPLWGEIGLWEQGSLKSPGPWSQQLHSSNLRLYESEKASLGIVDCQRLSPLETRHIRRLYRGLNGSLLLRDLTAGPIPSVHNSNRNDLIRIIRVSSPTSNQIALNFISLNSTGFCYTVLWKNCLNRWIAFIAISYCLGRD